MQVQEPIALGMGILLVLIGLAMAWRVVRLKYFGAKTEGEVVGYEYRWGGQQKTEPMYRPRIRFKTTYGQEVTTSPAVWTLGGQAAFEALGFEKRAADAQKGIGSPPSPEELAGHQAFAGQYHEEKLGQRYPLSYDPKHPDRILWSRSIGELVFPPLFLVIGIVALIVAFQEK